LALAKTEAGSYIILLHTPPDEYEKLYEEIFVPILEAFVAKE
jgi:hypothetical protein